MSAYVKRLSRGVTRHLQHESAYVSIRQETLARCHMPPAAYVSIRQHTSACGSIREHERIGIPEATELIEYEDTYIVV
jgi:hypothetical protein